MLTARPTPSPRPSRRAVLTGGAGVGAGLLAAVVSGCGGVSADDLAAADDTTAPAVDADSDLVEVVARQITVALTVAVATPAPEVRQLARRFAALHRSHLGELGHSVEGKGIAGADTSESPRARLLGAEERLQRKLVAASLDAESGALAQVFASMAAAVAQQRAVAS